MRQWISEISELIHLLKLKEKAEIYCWVRFFLFSLEPPDRNLVGPLINAKLMRGPTVSHHPLSGMKWHFDLYNHQPSSYPRYRVS